MEEPHRIAASADARHQDVGLPAPLLQALRPCLLADDGVEIPNHHGVRVWASNRTQDVVRGLHVCHPVPDGLARGVLQSRSPGLHAPHLRPKQPHPEHVQRLPLHVLCSHVDDALETEPGAHRGSGHAVLAGSRLRDDPLLSELLAHQGLAQGVVDLVRPRVVQVLPLEVNLRSVVLRKALRVIQRRRPAHVVPQKSVQLVLKILVRAQPRVILLQHAQRIH
mmetsp:Transcript_5994/g.20667  ORF Transcript_5994/g.20667 Transcript_5994/m.20667 type:complete len:222 (+) Transcript_5994:781-1446(+)